MKIDKEVKKSISEDWLKAFPYLNLYAQNKLYEILSCTITGIDIITLPHSEEYRPHFVMYPLWKKDVKTCMDAPILMLELFNKKGLQFNIPYAKHISYFTEAAEGLRKQIPILKNDFVSLKAIYDVINNRFNDILIKSNSAEQAKLHELKLNLALYSGNTNQVQNVINQIQKDSKNWNMQMFESWHGDFNLWLNGLNERVSDPQEFFKQIKTNKHDKKIERLKNRIVQSI